MLIEKIKTGTRLELEIITPEGQRLGLTHISQFIEVVNPTNILISCPIFESKYVFIALGTPLRLTFYHESAGTLFTFTGNLLHKQNKDQILMLQIALTSPIQKLQRRNYYRFDCNLSAKYRVLENTNSTESLSSSDETPEYHLAITKNISGNGASIVSEEEMVRGVTLEVVIQLHSAVSVKTKSTVMRVSEVTVAKGKKCEFGIYFNELTKKDQDEIIKYIFERQRELLKKS